MRIEDYKRTLDRPLRQRSVCFFVKENQVLLGRKKKGFGKGKWVGIGGKADVGEYIEETAIRETMEEIGVIPKDITRVATLNFYFPYVDVPAHWNQQVCVFLVDQWRGEIKESDEIAPQWFQLTKIPFNAMWADAKYWLVTILKGDRLRGEFLFDEQFEIVDFNIQHGAY